MALPFLLLKDLVYPTRKLRNQTAMNMKLFRYLTVAQLGRNAATGRKNPTKVKYYDESHVFGVNKATNTFVLMRIYSC